MYLVRYGELALKNERARNFFEKCLIDNIKAKCPKANVWRERGRIFVEGEADLKYTFGIVSYSWVGSCKPTLAAIQKHALRIKIRPTETFAVRVSRPWKAFPLTSQELEAKLGSEICKRSKSKVNLSAPDKTVYVEVRKDAAYLFSEKLPGPGGLPVGSGGKVVALVKNNRDLLACWMMMKRGCKPVVLNKDIDLSPIEPYAPSLTVHEDPGANLEKAKKLAMREKAKALVTGEPLGIYNDDVLVLRPLVGFSPEEVEEMGERIGTKATS